MKVFFIVVLSLLIAVEITADFLPQANVRGVSQDLGEATSARRKIKKKDGKKKKNESAENGLALCVVDKEGYSIPEGNKDYHKGDILYTNSITAIQAAAGAAGVLGSMADLSYHLTDNNGSLFASDGHARAQEVDDFIAAVNPVFSIASLVIGRSELDPSQSLIRDEFDKTKPNVDILSQHLATMYEEHVRNAAREDSFDHLNNQLLRTSSAYHEYINAALTMNSVAEEDYPKVDLRSIPTIKYRERFRMLCNDFDTPKDIIGVLYTALKQEGDLLDRFCFAGMREFKAWFVGSMVLALFLQQACLPSDLDFCPFENDPVFQESIDESIASLEEALVILENPETCSTENSSSLVLCKVDDRGYPIPEDSPDYEQGTNRFSKSITQGKITEIASEISGIFDIMADLSTKGAIASEVFDKAKEFTGKILLVGAAFSFVSFVIGRSEVDPTHQLILEQFEITNGKIDQLSRKISELYGQIRIDISDAVLDTLNNQLFRMASAYDDYTKAAAITNATIEDPEERKTLRRIYRENFRIACNELDFTPKDIIGILYGNACGDPGKYPCRCNKEGGADTGTCKHGIKQRSYALDKFRGVPGEQKQSIPRIRAFKSWLVGAMVQALFLQQACIPSNLNVCPLENDPIFEQNTKTSIAAIEEVIEVITATETCFCPCKKVKLFRFDLSDDFDDQIGSVASGWPWVGYAPTDSIDSTDPDNDGGERVRLEKCNSRIDSNFEQVQCRGRNYRDFVVFEKTPSLTENNNIHLWFEEDDFGKNHEYRKRIESKDWYRNTCEPYDLEDIRKDTDDGTIKYNLRIEPAETCPDEFCSQEFPDCGEGSCDFDNFKCIQQNDAICEV